ncbi:MAG TPA: radical SAM protein [Candidatus Nitrosotenuis sp.]|nr:radical SAM protein [Candidatus Nitrosotenuis sp.]
MRVAVILVWRPKNFPDWHSRLSPQPRVPAPLNYDKGAAPFTAVHIASLLPRNWQIEIVHEMVRDVNLDMDVNAVFLSTIDFCAPHAKHLAHAFRARGVRVIVGGLYPTLNPDYFQDCADAVVVGEAEPVIAQLVADLESDCLQPRYVAAEPADISDLPPPRYDLMETDFIVPMSYEATRGCPFSCSFCVLSAIRQPFRRRPIANVIRDIRNAPAHWNWLQRKYLIFWDNNAGSDRRYFRELCEALVPLKRIWGAETSIDTITPESARAMGKAGCRFLYIGLESLLENSLSGANKKHNRASEYRQRIGYLHENGILVMSIFLLGLDGDTPEYFRALPDLVHEVGVDVPVFSFAAPIEKTTFHRELRESSRLLGGDILGGMDGAHLLYRPKDLDPDELEMAVFQCMQRAYSPGRMLRRVVRTWRTGWWTALATTTGNLFYAPYQRALAREGIARIRARGPWPGPAVAPAEKDVEPLESGALVTLR